MSLNLKVTHIGVPSFSTLPEHEQKHFCEATIKACEKWLREKPKATQSEQNKNGTV